MKTLYAKNNPSDNILTDYFKMNYKLYCSGSNLLYHQYINGEFQNTNDVLTSDLPQRLTYCINNICHLYINISNTVIALDMKK